MSFKKNILPALALTLVLAFFLSLSPVNATTKDSNPVSGLVGYLSQKFNIDKNKLQAAVNEYKKEKAQKEEQKNQIKWNDKLVNQGKITQEQRKEILKEQELLKTKYDLAQIKDLSKEERQEQFDALKKEIEDWSSKTGIDAKYLMPGFGGFGFKGMHKGFWK